MTEAIVVTAEFRLKAGHVDEWLRLYEQWADRADFDASLGAAWRQNYHADTEPLWDKPRVMTIYRRIPTPWEPLDDDGLPRMFRN